MIETLSLIAQRPIRIAICPRRPGDLGCVVCSAEKAERELGWKAERGIVEMCRDLVNWQAVSGDSCATSQRQFGTGLMSVGVQLNPNGYQSAQETIGGVQEEEMSTKVEPKETTG